MSNTKDNTNAVAAFTGRKKIVISLIVVLLLAILIAVTWNRFTMKAEEFILELANEELAPNATIEFDQIQFRLIPAGVEIRDVRLVHSEPFGIQVPRKPLDTIRRFEAGSIDLRGISLFRLLFRDHLKLRSLTVRDLQVDLVPTSEDRITDSVPLTRQTDVEISELIVNNGTVTLYPDRNSLVYSTFVQHFDLHLQNITVDNPQQPLHSFFDHFKFEAATLSHLTDNNFYEFTADSIIMDSRNRTFSVRHFKNKPRLTPFEKARESGHQIDSFEITSGPVKMNGIQINRWLETGDIIADFIDIQDLSLEISRDKSFPSRERIEKPLPNSLIYELPWIIEVDSLKWRNGYVSYSELFSQNNRRGTIFFTEVELQINALQNRSAAEPIELAVQSRFIDRADLTLHIDFYTGAAAEHTVKGSLGELELSHVNEFLEPLAFAQVREGRLNSLDFTFAANEDFSNGQMTMNYSNLGLRFLNKDFSESSRLTNIRSFLTNTFAIRSNNDASDPRVADMRYNRDKERSVFNYWWRTLETGLLDSITR